MSKYILFLLFSLFAVISNGQTIEDLHYHADILMNAAKGKHRVKANAMFSKSFAEYLKGDDVDTEGLKAIKFIPQLTPSDDSFVLYTWQLKESEDFYKSFGFIRKSSGEVYKLNEGSPIESDILYESYTKENWLGVFYYKMMPTLVDGKKAWLLFGKDGHSKFNRRKVLDVLTFDENGEPVFGAEIFKKVIEGSRPRLTNRIVLTYSKDSNVSLNFNPDLDIIIHDHLINRMGLIPGQGETWLGDGSYEGYKWDGTHWVYDEKVFEQVTAEGEYPRPNPVLDIRKEGRGSR